MNACLLIALLAVLPGWVREVGIKYAEGRRDRYHQPEARRGEVQVAGFDAAVEAVRELVDPAGAYTVAVNPYGDGAITAIAMRLALLPRRPILAARFLEIPGKPALRPKATVIIESDATAPVVGATPEHLPGEVLAYRGARDDSIPGAVDEVTVNRKREVGIRGWCQAQEGGPCDVEAVLVRGRVVPSVVVDRHPRPDVAAVLPGLGPCLKAGYRVKVPAGFVGPGAVKIQVVFRTSDGRTRTYPAVAAGEVP